MEQWPTSTDPPTSNNSGPTANQFFVDLSRQVSLERLEAYRSPTRQTLGNTIGWIALFVQDSYNEGYILTHVGLLCWAPFPNVVMKKIPLRPAFLLLENVFTLYFWAMKSRSKYYIPKICPWPISSLEYNGVCSHNPVPEGITGADEVRHLNASPEEVFKIDLRDARKRRDARNEIVANQIIRDDKPVDENGMDMVWPAKSLAWEQDTVV
ncbi:hypothetical protein PV11_09306 [Exophiala sideris]|uniref:Uncharacterized protein n=1 Tax=Exophiala sideris TaxID=1016849 RepID=A0A0D1WR39_9EURO|nr:hypothetical protein PV11_09306 [Exophiala sideris]